MAKATYKDAGVDLDVYQESMSRLPKLMQRTFSPRVMRLDGGFAGLFKVDFKNGLFSRGYQNPILVSGTDGVGTKVEIANILKKFDTIGVDLVAMSVNDLIVQGAEPLIFLDYISTNKIEIKKLKSIIKGILKGCKLASCELVGGETAEMPGTYAKGKFDLAGFAVGIVANNKILYKNKIKKGNLILAVPSSGIHSNGYSLIRYILKKKKINILKNNYLKKELIKPTKIYVREILKLVDKKLLNGCANITGGGLEGNVVRVLPSNLSAKIYLDKIKPNRIFKWLYSQGVSDKEMLKTFNCGIGFCIIIKSKNVNKIKKYFTKNFKPYVIGKIINGKKNIQLNGKVKW